MAYRFFELKAQPGHPIYLVFKKAGEVPLEVDVARFLYNIHDEIGHHARRDAAEALIIANVDIPPPTFK